jgi:hypothetical protein
MKLSSSFILLTLLLVCAPAAARSRASDKPLLAPAAALSSDGPRLQLGLFDGTGRACGGQLKITPKRLSWSPPFNPCPPTAYTLAERRQEGSVTRWVYQRVGAPKSCFYKAVVLEKTVDSDGRISWNAVSFTSMKAYKANSNVWLSCYLIKLD